MEEEEIFKGKTLSDIMKEVYDNHKSKKRQIEILIEELKPLVTTITDATLLVPLIKEYLELGLKNDDQLVKLANLAQKLISLTSDGGGDFMTEAEKDALLKDIKDTKFKDDATEGPSK
jgi:hypothetical protein